MAEDTLIDRSNPLPTESGRGVTISMESWLAWRRAAGRHIDPATAEVTWWYAQTLDPYGVCPDLPEEYRQVGREYFARSPGDDLWISFCDLPEATPGDALGKTQFQPGIPGRTDDRYADRNRLRATSRSGSYRLDSGSMRDRGNRADEPVQSDPRWRTSRHQGRPAHFPSQGRYRSLARRHARDHPTAGPHVENGLRAVRNCS
jgi:hypothetical protein